MLIVFVCCLGVVVCALLVVGRWLSVVSCRLLLCLVVGCRFSFVVLFVGDVVVVIGVVGVDVVGVVVCCCVLLCAAVDCCLLLVAVVCCVVLLFC